MKKSFALPREKRDELYGLVQRVGVKRVCDIAGLSKLALLNAIGGEPILRGTASLIENAVRALAA